MIRIIGWINDLHDAEQQDLLQLLLDAREPGRSVGIISTGEIVATTVWEGEGTYEEVAQALKEAWEDVV